MYILVINLGSTSSKIAVYDKDTKLFLKNIMHEASDLVELKTTEEQKAFRKKVILKEIETAGYDLAAFEAICSRGGVLKPVKSGTYLIDENVVRDGENPEIGGKHPSCLGVLIAYELSVTYGIPAYFVDPVSTDELVDEARLSGFKGMERLSLFHALNQKAAARKTAEILGKPYESLNLIGVHMGGGVCVAAHQKGRVIDNYCVNDDGCFSMDRGGNLPTTALVDLCYSGKSKDEVKTLLKSQSGVYSYLGTKDFIEVEARVKAGDKEADLVFKAMVFQHAKCIGSMAAIMKFKVDAIFLTGGMANSAMLCDAIKAYIADLAPVYVLPGENEMESLAKGAVRVLQGESARVY